MRICTIKLIIVETATGGYVTIHKKLCPKVFSTLIEFLDSRYAFVCFEACFPNQVSVISRDKEHMIMRVIKGGNNILLSWHSLSFLAAMDNKFSQLVVILGSS